MKRKQTKVNTTDNPSHTLFAEERRRLILGRLVQFGKVTVEDLSTEFALSTATIRADLSKLEADGELSRTHGGAIAKRGTLYEPNFDSREVMRFDEKRSIAAEAVKLIRTGETVLIDAGTTAHEIAKLLVDRTDITVVTNSLPVVNTLLSDRGPQVLFVGGLLQSQRQAVLGSMTCRFLREVHVDRAFMAFNGVHADAGFSVIDFEAAELKKQMMQSATDVVVVADSAKVGQISFALVASVSEAQVLITDSGINAVDVDGLRNAGLIVKIA